MIWVGSGHGIDPHITPVYRRAASGGTFFTLPIVMRNHSSTDFFEVIADAPTQVSANMEWSNAGAPAGTNFGGFYTISNITGLPVLVTGSPQEWHEDFPILSAEAGLYALRQAQDLGPDTLSFQSAALGVFRGLASTYNARVTTLFAVKPDVRENTSVWEIAALLDLSTILARSTMTVRAENLP